MQEGRDRHFDPDLLDGFVELSDDFSRIAECYQDAHQEIADRRAIIQLFLGSNYGDQPLS